MRTIQLTLAYDGTHFAGWQVQPRARTVQAELERALATVTGETIRAVASGRTDAGVHALAQVVSFQTASGHSEEVFHRALNAELPDDVAISGCRQARDGFHAIADAMRKRYRYLLHDGPLADVFLRHHCWKVWQPLDHEKMRRAAGPLIGTHDFRSFQASGSERKSTVRTVFDLTVDRDSDRPDVVTIEIEADGFLYNMARNIVGTLVEVGRGAEEEAWPLEVLKALDRRTAGMTAPPQGLFLVRVDYDEQE